MKALTLDNGPIMRVAGLDDDAVAIGLAYALARLPQLLPPRCVREIDGFGSKHSKRLRAREQLVMSEVAISALGQFSRSLCEQQDELYRLHRWFRPERGELDALLGSLAGARLLALRSVLLAQLDRECDVRMGLPISPDVKLPIGAGSGSGGGGGGGGGAELELVPLDPDDPDGGGGGGGDGGGAAPAVVVAPMPPDSAGPDADVDDDYDVLGFLNRDR